MWRGGSGRIPYEGNSALKSHPIAFRTRRSVVIKIVICPASIFWITLGARSASSASFS